MITVTRGGYIQPSMVQIRKILQPKQAASASGNHLWRDMELASGTRGGRYELLCGIVGFRGSVGLAGQDAAVVRRMADQLRHRGPDDEGVWADETAGIALSQRRLSIVDLSPAGYQPMFSACQRYV